MDQSLISRVKILLEPGYLLAAAIKFFIIVVFRTVFIRLQPLGLFRIQKLRDESFSMFWLNFMSNPPPDDVSQLAGSAALIPPLLSQARGDVLDIGPGSGMQLRYFPKPSKSPVKRIYGAEPSVGLHSQLRRSADEAGLGSSYIILPCVAEERALAEALAEAGIIDTPTNKAGLFDTIVCVRVLCSVPEPFKAIRNFHRLLRPGGQLLVAEHVINPWRSAKGSLLARLAQVLYMFLGWKFFIGDCCMNRDIEMLLGEAGAIQGGWDTVEIERHFGLSALPYISGRLVKRS